MNIKEFKIGAKIVRVLPSKRIGDRSYLGHQMEFKGIANGLIYLYRKETHGSCELTLPLDIWDEDWEYYTDDLTSGMIGDGTSGTSIFKERFLIDLKKIVNIAKEEEDYEFLSEIKSILANG